MYGGGGVEPDHRLEGPIEGFNPGRFARQLFARQVFASFAQKFSAVGDTRIAVTGKDRKFVAKDFTVDAAMLRSFREHLEAEGVKIDEAAFTQDLAFITAMIRYEIDLNLWTVEDARRHLIIDRPAGPAGPHALRRGGTAGAGGPGAVLARQPLAPPLPAPRVPGKS